MSALRLALAGDTMLGRAVGETIRREGVEGIVAHDVATLTRAADVFLLNLECCISSRGTRWPDPRKPFFFRGPPEAVDLLVLLGVDCVTLANNHALDYGPVALLDTIELLGEAGIAVTGAGVDEQTARAATVLQRNGLRLGVIGLTDHPADFAASPRRPGVAYADLRTGIPEWVTSTLARLEADTVLVSPHWGPNMTSHPVPHVRMAAARLLEAGADLIAGHSAHVFHGAGEAVIYDLGDFVNDYAVDPVLRNDLGLLWFVELDREGSIDLMEAFPLALDYCHTRMAVGDEVDWIERRLDQACRQLGTHMRREEERFIVESTRLERGGAT